ncbi:nidogen-like domain-containing protein [Microvirga yunnanensis]|uniref:nidogen-like domain-containing protein n=1 Tax=Microvirga yunnanensis TaxID=2953740 RepID=UPI0021CA3C8E|nr:nidogen-like domain-containing protein [Microvirga sp. HBU65207]
MAIIAPFWADVDTRGAGSQVTYGLNHERDSFIVTWSNVDYYNAVAYGHTSKFNSFQLELTDQGGGNFNIIFRYGGLTWTTGDASYGSNGLGGYVARAGFSSGDGEHYFELPQSGSESGMLGLTSSPGSMNNPGVWEFEVRSGEVRGIGSERGDSLFGDDSDNFIDGRSGNDRIEAGAGNDRVLGGSGDDTLVAGHGQGNDTYDGGADIDTITFTSTSRGVTVNLSAGTAYGSETDSDLITGVEHVIAGYGNDTVVGDALSNRLSALSGKDTIKGEAGDDLLFGGLGNDKLYGGDGWDTFVFDSKLGTSKTDRKVNFDTISDFKVADDTIWLDNKVFTKLGRNGSEAAPALLNKKYFTVEDKAKDANDYIVYNKKTGVLSYDSDGSGAKEAVEFAQLKKGLALKFNDFFVV